MRSISMLFVCLLLCISQLFAQNRTIKGSVTDDKGAFVANASVVVKGTSIGTVTDAGGNFSISVPASARILVISSLNFAPQEINLSGKNQFSIKLLPTAENLDEVVVTGYGTVKKVNSTASQAKIGGKQIENVPVASLDRGLQGKVAGLQSSSANGQPGSNQDVRIRGIGSFTASASPLYVVDGVQIVTGDLSSAVQTTNVLSTINPNDIEDIAVLKDAAATSIYGSRGANGVIVITTKRGRAGKTQFRFDTEVGQTNYANIPDAGKPIGRDDWFTLLKEGLVNGGYSATQITNTMASYGFGNGVDINWLDLTTRKGTQQQYNLSMTAGDAKTQIFMSGGYFKQEATNIGADLKRISGNIKVTHNISSKLSLSTNWNIGNILQNTPPSGPGQFANPYYVSLTLRPTQNPFNPDGSYNIGTTDNLSFPAHYNPLYVIANDKYIVRNTQIIGGGSLEYKILNGLKFTSHIGIQDNRMEESVFQNPFHGDGVAVGGFGQNNFTRAFLWDWYNQLDYHTDLLRNKKLSADFKLGYEANKYNYYRIQAASQNYPPTADLPLATNAATATQGSADAANYTFASMYSSANFSYDSRFSLYGSFRRDGSSRFGANNQYGNFWAVGAAWNINNEAFMEQLKAISLLKLRGSYGSTGNAGIGNYQWRQTYGYGANYNGNAGGTFNNIGNIDLTWEKTNQTDIGLDLGLFKNRINIVVDWYKKLTDGLLFNKPISLTTGFGSILSNVGKIENKGIEFTINARAVDIRNFSWDIGFNISHNQNRVVSLPGGQDIANGIFRLSEGRDIQSYYTRALKGVDPATGVELWYKDATKATTTPTYASAALQFVDKSGSPSYFGSLSNSFSYKGYYISGDLYYNYGNYVTDRYSQYFLNAQFPTRGKYAINLTRWQKPGDITSIPKYIYGQTNQSNGERQLYKGDYVRLRNITIGYRMEDKNLLSKLHLTSLNFYVRGTNIWTKTYDKLLPFDPEQGADSQNNEGFLNPKTITLGLNIGF
ncbi:MAG: SusC/RagA family TonB-linked outer membrane protein [Bacteroidota bacterium]|nr:SusC/RagA family TonB-linked outer membrane protein [Bacteroidota bacterium]